MATEHLLASILRKHIGPAEGANAYTAIHAAVDELEALREPHTEQLVNRVEYAMARALNAGVPWERVDEYIELSKTMRES